MAKKSNPETRLDVFSRRSFLRWTAVVGVGATLGWRFLAPSRGPELRGLKHLSPNEARILAAVYSVITGDDVQVSVESATRSMDGFMTHLCARDRRELRAALHLVEQTPLLFHGFLSRFTALNPKDQAHCLDGWRLGAAWRRPVFVGLKDLSYLAFYTRSTNWASIGYAGPIIPMPTLGIGLEPQYAALLARFL
ncbi:twin-arginine translocation signal domain-containing protein [Bdellovibrionota bacterium FG-1]